MFPHVASKLGHERDARMCRKRWRPERTVSRSLRSYEIVSKSWEGAEDFGCLTPGEGRFCVCLPTVLLCCDSELNSTGQYPPGKLLQQQNASLSSCSSFSMQHPGYVQCHFVLLLK